jgi:hypothetical protein
MQAFLAAPRSPDRAIPNPASTLAPGSRRRR